MAERQREDPIRGWQAARQQPAAAVVDQDGEQDTAPVTPSVPLDALTPGGKPSGYQAPTPAAAFRQWVEDSLSG